MRIIAGDIGGLKLKTIKNTTTRPTTDRIKESIFNIILPYLWEDMQALDLFAGFGGVGLEALSRGIALCSFVEKDRRNISVIKENIEKCRFQEKAEVYCDDVFDFLEQINEGYDLIFMDPPYGLGYVEQALGIIKRNKLLNEQGLLVIEEKKKFSLDSSKLSKGYTILREKIYGDTLIVILTCIREDSNF